MRAWPLVMFSCSLAWLSGCSPSGTAAKPSDDPGAKGSRGAKACAGVGSSTLPGVCLELDAAEGTWTLAQVADGISIPYAVVVEADVAGVVPASQDAGSCESPDESGLIVFARITGGEQQYCECDSGLCPGFPEPAVTLAAGRTPSSIEWTGRNWYGASDTSNPLGPPFPPGDYTLELSARGTVDGQPFEVRNSFAIHLTP